MQIQKLQYWMQQIIPQVYDDSMSFYELQNAVMKKLDEIIDSVNDYFSKDLEEVVGTIIQGWYDDGTLADIININVFNMKADTTYVNTQLGLKAAAADLTAANGRIDAANTEIAKKINITEVANVGKSGSYTDLTNKPIISNRDRTLNVATWNIRSGMNKAGSYIDLTLNSRDILIEGSYDLVGLQECRVNYSASNVNSKDPVNAIANPDLAYRKFGKAIDLADEPTASYGVGMLSRYGTYGYSQRDLPNPTASENRILLQATLVMPDKKKITVFTTHLQWTPTQTRIAQLTEIRNTLTALGTQSFILMGDFNVEDRAEFATYFGAWNQVQGTNGFFQSYNDTTYVGERAIDNIVCSKDLTISDAGMHSNIFSDHDVLYCKISY